MNNDDVIWSVLRVHCGYRHKLPVNSASKTGRQGREAFCRHPQALTGKCEKGLCPLANQRYATVMEDKGKIYLYAKTAERAHQPRKWWEKIILPIKYKLACQKIEEELEGYPAVYVRWCKKRFLRHKQILKRTRRLLKKKKGVLVPITKKHARVEATKERKAHVAAKVDLHIKEELLKRLREGMYDSTIEGFNEDSFLKLAEQELEREEQAVSDGDEEHELDSDKEFEQEHESAEAFDYPVYEEADSDDSDYDSVSEDSENDQPETKKKRPHLAIGSGPKKPPRPPKRSKVVIEHEREEEREPQQLADW